MFSISNSTLPTRQRANGLRYLRWGGGRRSRPASLSCLHLAAQRPDVFREAQVDDSPGKNVQA